MTIGETLPHTLPDLLVCTKIKLSPSLPPSLSLLLSRPYVTYWQREIMKLWRGQRETWPSGRLYVDFLWIRRLLCAKYEKKSRQKVKTRFSLFQLSVSFCSMHAFIFRILCLYSYRASEWQYVLPLFSVRQRLYSRCLALPRARDPREISRHCQPSGGGRAARLLLGAHNLKSSNRSTVFTACAFWQKTDPAPTAL